MPYGYYQLAFPPGRYTGAQPNTTPQQTKKSPHKRASTKTASHHNAMQDNPYSFTPPWVRPAINCLDASIKAMMVGPIMMRMPANIMCH